MKPAFFASAVESGFVSFGDDWQPRYMPFDAWHRTALNVRLGRRRTANAAYHIGFSPVYGRLDLPWKPLAVSPAVMLLYAFIAIYAVVLFWLVFIR